MRALIQRVSSASVSISGDQCASIGRGFLILLGIGRDDGREEAEKLWKKISGLRIFRDEEGKTNLSLKEVGGNVLTVSQFTLWANCRKGNRPSFLEAAGPEQGDAMYCYFLELVKADYPESGSGVFGADMDVELVNEGPFTIWLDTDHLERRNA